MKTYKTPPKCLCKYIVLSKVLWGGVVLNSRTSERVEMTKLLKKTVKIEFWWDCEQLLEQNPKLRLSFREWRFEELALWSECVSLQAFAQTTCHWYQGCGFRLVFLLSGRSETREGRAWCTTQLSVSSADQNWRPWWGSGLQCCGLVSFQASSFPGGSFRRTPCSPSMRAMIQICHLVIFLSKVLRFCGFHLVHTKGEDLEPSTVVLRSGKDVLMTRSSQPGDSDGTLCQMSLLLSGGS